VITFWG